MGITKRLSLFISMLVLAVSLVLAFIAITISTNIVRHNTEESMEGLAGIGAGLVEAKIQHRLDVLYEMANTTQVQSMNRETQASFLRPYIEGDIDDLAIIDLQSNAWHIKGGQIPNLSQREYVQKVLRGEMGISDLIPANASAVPIDFPVLNYVVPIKVDDKVVGALLARTNAYNLSDIVKTFKVRGDGYAYMINGQGQTIAHAVRRESVLNLDSLLELAKEDPAYESLGETIRHIVSVREGYSEYTFGGKRMLCGFSPVPGFNMILILSASEESLMTDVVTLRKLMILVVAIFIGIGLGVSIWIAHSMAKPLSTVSEVLQKIGNGDFTQKVNIKRNDEIGSICSSLNESTDNVRNLVLTIKKTAATLSKMGDHLASSMVQADAAVTQITTNVENVKNRVLHQSSSVSKSNNAVKQISGNIRSLSDHVDEQSESVAQSSSAIEEMLANVRSVTQTLIHNEANVNHLASAAGTGRSGLQNVVSDIQEIAKQSEGLMEINAVMENISSQTNLLSMNAAIEAAHAGESGRGFAVVASEIRKLAESSSVQSKTISEVLKKIKTAIDKITSSTNTVLAKFEAIDSGVRTVSQQEDAIRLSMEEQNEGSQQILEAIGKLNELTRQVKTGSTEMQDGSKQIMNESRSLAEATEEISGGMDDMENGVNQIGIAVDQVNETSVETKQNIEVLVGEIEKFKVS
ncbi:MAG: methyl-accepting chemotaxis protein [Treponema sp.]|jgi:methyl-accepting chemotaxis protein|nr:methyl-accepting chemotaxis protein [Treponema sp.]